MIRSVIIAAALAAAAPVFAAPAFAAPAEDGARIEQGHKVFDYWCASCHGPGIGSNGVNYLPGTNALLAKYKGAKPALLSERTDLTPDLVKYFVRNGISIMPYFRKTEVSDKDLDAVATYLARNFRP